MTSIFDLGKYRVNPDADPLNNLVLTDDCESCGQATVCQDNLSRASAAATVKALTITYDGTPYTAPDGGIRVDNPVAIEDWVYSVIGAKEVDLYVDAAYVGTTFTMQHIGAGSITAMTFDSGAAATVTRDCIADVICDFILGQLVGDTGNLVNGASSSAAANGPYAYSGNSVTDLATAATFKTDLETALAAVSATYILVTVELDEVFGGYTVTINAKEPFEVTLGGEKFLPANCVESFT